MINLVRYLIDLIIILPIYKSIWNKLRVKIRMLLLKQQIKLFNNNRIKKEKISMINLQSYQMELQLRERKLIRKVHLNFKKPKEILKSKTWILLI